MSQEIKPAPIKEACPFAEAVKGYMRDRTELLRQREMMGYTFVRYAEMHEKYTKEIAFIDETITKVLHQATINSHVSNES